MPELSGILLPLTISRGAADVATGQGPALRKTHVRVILGTRASAARQIGEWAPDPSRGSQLDALRNAGNSVALADFATAYVQDALAQLPEEVLKAVDVGIDDRVIEITATTQLAADASRNPAQLESSVTVQR